MTRRTTLLLSCLAAATLVGACGSPARPSSSSGAGATGVADSSGDQSAASGEGSSPGASSGSAASAAPDGAAAAGASSGAGAPSPAAVPAGSSSATSAPTPSRPATPPPTPAVTAAPGSTPSFDDEFDGSSLDTSKWLANDSRIGRTSNGEVQCYLGGNVTVGGGLLSETVRQDGSCPGFSYTSGAVQMRSFSFTYGTVEVRARLAGGSGPWPAIWLLGLDCRYWRMPPGTGCSPPWPQPGSDEIDIAETLNSDHAAVNEEIHSTAGTPACSAGVSDTSANWHVYRLTWTPGRLVFAIDGTTTCTLTQGVPSHPMFLILDTALGGSGGGGVDPSTLPQTSAFDYVRVWTGP